MEGVRSDKSVEIGKKRYANLDMNIMSEHWVTAISWRSID